MVEKISELGKQTTDQIKQEFLIHNTYIFIIIYIKLYYCILCITIQYIYIKAKNHILL